MFCANQEYPIAFFLFIVFLYLETVIRYFILTSYVALSMLKKG